MSMAARIGRRRRVGAIAVVAVVLLGGVLAVGRTRLLILATRALVAGALAAPPTIVEPLASIVGVRGALPARVASADVAGDGPILVVTAPENPFTRYLVEILRAEGLDALGTLDAARLTPAALAARHVVVLGETPLDAAQVAMLAEWTEHGGTLIAMRPGAPLANLLGLERADGTLADGYLRVDDTAPPGAGIVAATMQFHGTADLWIVRPASELPTGEAARVVATLHRDTSSPTPYPAVTVRRVGTGVAAAFTYDLARSVVFTRQGNPAWAGQRRLGLPPIRAVDLFAGDVAGHPEPDWIDFQKRAIPQADEQQRLLANLILDDTAHGPLPRWWYLPRGWQAAIVMTGDAHDDSAVARRLEQYRAASPAGCSVDDWECVRATVYLYPGTSFTAAEAVRDTSLGFEVALHPSTRCGDWTPPVFGLVLGLQRATFGAIFPDIPTPTTSRTHCAAWSDWSSAAEIEASYGIRLDANYYDYPASWVRGRAGLFTGSALPMRFAATDGRVIDCWQAATQITDESGLPLPAALDELLDRATGPEGYYGVLTVNVHFDEAHHPGSDAIVASALRRGVPVVTARQMLTWLDGRDASSFESLDWRDGVLTFTMRIGAGARQLRGMLPLRTAGGELARLEHEGAPVPFETRTVKGIAYAFFAAEGGRWAAVYATHVDR